MAHDSLPECLADKPLPVPDGADEVAVVNEIKGVGFV